ncbi:lytic transglycosylase domain-containing protein [Deinococcus koreensis]|uniref:Lytic transglycosylase catalytic n=1 Tax=Deinococcus koreensis TaxID=2054903 RepID=A0A2K3UTQ4_9DEIO|nr:lytic transglycosylase domain-containing protein [Deinococcus koreensis]PNY79919.1 lytic transglycosylase catalytic [Deinococcus koreensis]
MNRLLIPLTICAASSQALACKPLSAELQATVTRSASTFGLDAGLLTALIWTESRFCIGAVSPVGALGLGQLMPRTAAALGVDAHDPHQNIYGAAKYLRQMWDTFHNWTHAIAAYNAGPGAVQRYRGIPPYAETQAYVRKVLGAYQQPTSPRPRPATAAVAVRSGTSGAPVATVPLPAPYEAPRAPIRTAAQAAARVQALRPAPPVTAALPQTAAVGPASNPVKANALQPGLVLYTVARPAQATRTGGLSVFDLSAPSSTIR